MIVLKKRDKPWQRDAVIPASRQFIRFEVTSLDPANHCSEIDTTIFGNFASGKSLFSSHDNAQSG